jgi:hypothetical protein
MTVTRTTTPSRPGIATASSAPEIGGTRTARGAGMTRFRMLLYDPRLWRIASLLLTLVLVACQNYDGGGGGGGGGGDPGY